MTRRTTPAYVPPDGILNRPLEAEARINEQAAVTFKDPCGQEFLKYLRSITIEMVHGPGNLDPNAIIFKEGQRSLVAIIEQRIKHGKARKPNVPKPVEKPK